ncbi:MAG: TIGR00730 family Rossman fold protein [Acidobacteriota bacterium]
MSRVRILVFCGANVGDEPAYAEAATRLGKALAARDIGLVYGAGDVGLMGVIADAVLGEGGEVIGVIPQALVDREVAHRGLTELHVTETMHQRKQIMYDLADASISMPGGIGTLDEFFESLTWNQLGYLNSPCGVLNVVGYFDPLIAMLDSMTAKGFLGRGTRDLVHVDADPDALIDRLLGARTGDAKWPVGGPVDRG